MTTPRVSIIIPVFNAARFLRECIDSALEQREIPFEIIAVDDGSTDGSLTILRSYSQSIQLLESAHGGASAARNLGTARATGEFLQYLDADDRLRPGTLLIKVKALEASGADVAYSGWQRLQETDAGKFVLTDELQPQMEAVDPDPVIAWLTQFWCPPAAMLYRRRIVDRIGGWNPRLPFIQDARFGLDAAMQGARFHRVPGISADYRVYGKSLSRRDPNGFAKDVFDNAREVETLWHQRGALTPQQRKALSDVYNYTCRQFLRRDDPLFQDSLRALYGVQPGFRFNWPKTAGLLSTLMGSRAARRIMRMVRPDSV